MLASRVSPERLFRGERVLCVGVEGPGRFEVQPFRVMELMSGLLQAVETHVGAETSAFVSPILLALSAFRRFHRNRRTKRRRGGW